MSQKKGKFYWAQKLVPPGIDFITVASVLVLVPWLGEQIMSQSAINHFFLLPGFFFIFTGVLAIRHLPKYSVDDSKGLSFFATALVFLFLSVYVNLYTYATNLGGSEAANDNWALVFFMILLIPFLIVFYIPTSNTKPGSKTALISESIGLISVNYLTIIGAAVWSGFMSTPIGDDPVFATGASFLILFVILYLLFLAFFGLPRLYLLRATGDKIGLAAYLIGAAIFLWDKLPPVN